MDDSSTQFLLFCSKNRYSQERGHETEFLSAGYPNRHEKPADQGNRTSTYKWIKSSSTFDHELSNPTHRPVAAPLTMRLTLCRRRSAFPRYRSSTVTLPIFPVNGNGA